MKKYTATKWAILTILEIALFFVLFTSIANISWAGVGTNVTVQTLLQVGNTWPEVLNVSVNDGAASITLVANSSVIVQCVAVIRDYNNESDISNVNATFYHTVDSTLTEADDNNRHYTNYSCSRNDSFVSYNGYNDDSYTTLANCTFSVQYYANPGLWNCSVTVNDSIGWIDTGSDTINISSLLALGLPSNINYGVVNATSVSNENETIVTNVGNTLVNLSLEGYARAQGDNYAMNCSYGNVQNISIYYEKYNLTTSVPGPINLTQFEANYTNLSSSAVVKYYNLSYRQNDTYNEAFKPSYWRIYVPRGVAGNCTGNIIFGATTAPGT